MAVGKHSVRSGGCRGRPTGRNGPVRRCPAQARGVGTSAHLWPEDGPRGVTIIGGAPGPHRAILGDQRRPPGTHATPGFWRDEAGQPVMGVRAAMKTARPSSSDWMLTKRTMDPAAASTLWKISHALAAVLQDL